MPQPAISVAFLAGGLLCAGALAGRSLPAVRGEDTTNLGGPERPEAREAGAGLARDLGCGACHEGVPPPESMETAAPILGAEVRPLPAEYVFGYLADPVRVRPGIDPARMPRFPLSEEERLALALFLSRDDTREGGDPEFRDVLDRHPGVGRPRGRELFRALNCAGCHPHEGFVGERGAPDLSLAARRLRREWLQAYLESPGRVRPAGSPPGSGSRMPDFRLTPAEGAALMAFLLPFPERGPGSPPFDPPSITPFSMSRAERLIREELPCLGCHRLGPEGGRMGPPLDGVADRLEPEAVRAIIQDPASAVPGTLMPRTPLTEDRLDLLTAFLVHRPGGWRESEPAGGLMERIDPPEAGNGEGLYRRHCAHCHGVGGAGDGYNAPYLPIPPTAHDDSAYMSTRSDDTLFDGIHAGGRILDRNHRMPAFGQDLTREEIRSLVGYMRQLCRCQGPS